MIYPSKPSIPSVRRKIKVPWKSMQKTDVFSKGTTTRRSKLIVIQLRRDFLIFFLQCSRSGAASLAPVVSCKALNKINGFQSSPCWEHAAACWLNPASTWCTARLLLLALKIFPMTLIEELFSSSFCKTTYFWQYVSFIGHYSFKMALSRLTKNTTFLIKRFSKNNSTVKFKGDIIMPSIRFDLSSERIKWLSFSI